MSEHSYREMIIETLNKLTISVSEEHRYEVEAFSQIIKGMALSVEDVEVIGLASMLENKAQKLIKQENYAYDHMYDDDIEHLDNSEKVRQQCIKVFYKDNEFSADMTKYENIINENEKLLKETNRYDRLSRYIDEKKVIDKIYCKIKGNLATSSIGNNNFSMPTEQSIKDLFPIELKEIYRLADNHVSMEIKKAEFDKKES